MKIVLMCIALLSLGGTQIGRELKVTKTRGMLMEKPQYFGRSIADLNRDQTVTVLDDSRFPWLKVKVAKSEKQGFMHVSSFAKEGKVSFAAAADAAELAPTASSSHVNLASRDLTPSAGGANVSGEKLKGAFERLHAQEEADALTPDDEEMRAFIEDGKLGGAK